MINSFISKSIYLFSKMHYDKIQSYVKLAEEEGGTIILGEKTKR